MKTRGKECPTANKHELMKNILMKELELSKSDLDEVWQKYEQVDKENHQ